MTKNWYITLDAQIEDINKEYFSVDVSPDLGFIYPTNPGNAMMGQTSRRNKFPHGQMILQFNYSQNTDSWEAYYQHVNPAGKECAPKTYQLGKGMLVARKQDMDWMRWNHDGGDWRYTPIGPTNISWRPFTTEERFQYLESIKNTTQRGKIYYYHNCVVTPALRGELVDLVRNKKGEPLELEYYVDQSILAEANWPEEVARAKQLEVDLALSKETEEKNSAMINSLTAEIETLKMEFKIAQLDRNQIIYDLHNKNANLSKVEEELTEATSIIQHQTSIIEEIKHKNEKLETAIRSGIREVHAERDRKVKEVENKAAEDVRKAQAVQTLSRYTLPQIVNQYLELNSDIVTELTDPKRHSELHHLNLIRWSEHEDLLAIKHLIESKEDGPIFTVDDLIQRVRHLDQHSFISEANALVIAVDQLREDFNKGTLPESAKDSLNKMIDKKSMESKIAKKRVALIHNIVDQYLSGDNTALDEIFETAVESMRQNPQFDLYSDDLQNASHLLQRFRNINEDKNPDDLMILVPEIKSIMVKTLRYSSTVQQAEAVQYYADSKGIKANDFDDFIKQLIDAELIGLRTHAEQFSRAVHHEALKGSVVIHGHFGSTSRPASPAKSELSDEWEIASSNSR